MKKILKHLRKNWIRHGFETLVVVVSVLIAFTLNNWNENIKSVTNPGLNGLTTSRKVLLLAKNMLNDNISTPSSQLQHCPSSKNYLPCALDGNSGHTSNEKHMAYLLPRQ